MKRHTICSAVLGLVLAAPAFAGGINLSGPHYNLNIIGVENPKTATLTDSNRHTIFVALGTKTGDYVKSKIYLTPGDFAVCDGNSLDEAFDCDGNQVAPLGAVFQLPCNTNVTADVGCDGGVDQAAYAVYARALGGPGGSAFITTCVIDDTGTEICSTNSTPILSHVKGKPPTFINVTQALGTFEGCFDVNGSSVCQTISLFDPRLEQFLWEYSNKGQRLVQLRFYLIE